MKEKLRFLVAAVAAIALVCGAPVSADQPQAGFRGATGQTADTDLDDLAGFPSGIGQANKVIGINAAGTAYERKTLTQTANQVLITHGVGTVTFSTPQDIATSSLPTFAGTILSAALRPSSAGGTTVGTSALPFSSLYVGGSATNNIQITGTSTAARTFTLPDANSNPVQPDTGASNNFLTGISSAGVITKAQPAFSNISGTATAAQGGTGVNGGAAANGSLLIGNGSGYSLATLTQGSGVTITNGAGTITIAASSASLKFTPTAKSANFSANGASGTYYRISATANADLGTSPADGTIYKFKVTSGTTTFLLSGGEVINRADGTTNATGTLTLTASDGVVELVAVTGGWDET